MKLKNIIGFLLLSMAFVTVACDDDVEYTITEVDAPVLVSTTPENGSTNVSSGDVTISITYDKNVFFASSYADQLIFTGGTVTSADCHRNQPHIDRECKPCPERGNTMHTDHSRRSGDRTESDAGSRSKRKRSQPQDLIKIRSIH